MLYVFEAHLKVKELIKYLEKQGWHLDRIRGSHHVFVHANASRSITVPVHGKDIADHFAKSIQRQASQALSKQER
jgi:predicted RNA binding protein YcfA (HicA-like mRNA interferase family)